MADLPAVNLVTLWRIEFKPRDADHRPQATDQLLALWRELEALGGCRKIKQRMLCPMMFIETPAGFNVKAHDFQNVNILDFRCHEAPADVLNARGTHLDGEN